MLLGYLLVTPDRSKLWFGNGRLVPVNQLPSAPPFFDDFDAARTAARALAKVNPALRLRPCPAWAG
jgi:hypothetical protein